MSAAGGASPFYRAFKVSTFIVVALGYLAIWLSGRVGPVAGVIMAASVVATWSDRPWPQLSERFWRVVALLFIAWLGISYFVMRTPSLIIACELLIFLQVQRLYTRRENRDYAWVYLIAFLQVLLGCILTVAPAFAFVLLGFLVAITWAMLLFQLKQGMDTEVEEAPQASEVEPWPARLRAFILGAPDQPAQPVVPPEVRYAHARGLLSGAFVATTTAVTLLMLSTTLAIFLIAPRLDLSFFHQDSGDKTHLSGFSDNVALGELGEILLGTGKVMRVRMEGPLIDAGATFPLYWRGTALDRFDGTRWVLSRDQRQRFGGRGSFLNPRTPPVANLIQDITLEPLDTDVIFAMRRALAFEVDASSLYRTVTGGFHIERSRARLNYKVYSWIDRPDPEVLRGVAGVYPDAMEEIYLQLPVDLSPRVREEAERVTAAAGNTYDKAKAIEAWLRSDFEYTLTPQSTGSAPLEDFLFRTRAGHCEYFASGMVIMLRTLGVPSRIVNGFAGGVYNDFGGYWVVAQSDAHTWVEVFFPREGWVRFDPTPAAITQGFGTTEGAVAMYLDYLESLWYFYVLDYGLQVQLDFVRDLFKGWGFDQGGGRLRSRDREQGEPEAFKIGRGVLQALGAAVALGIVGVLGIRLRRGILARGAERAPYSGSPVAVRRYLALRRRLERGLVRLGLERGQSETHHERAQRSCDVSPALGAALSAVEGDFYQLRFGGMTISEDHLRRLKRALQTLRSVKPRPGAS